MKILIVSYYFPPQNSIASLRPYSWAKWWSRAGHDVTVLTIEKKILKNNLNLDCSMFKLIEVPFQVPFQSVNGVVENCNNSKPIKTTFKQRFLLFTKSICSIFVNKTGCFLACRFPCWTDLWIKKALKYINNNDFDLLVTTGWPYAVHRVGLDFRKKGWKGKWICDWRDLWTQNHMFPGIKVFHPYERYLENKFHKNANIITTVSEPLADSLRSITNTPVNVIYNGYDEEDFSFLFEKERDNNDKFIISYLGTIYRPFQNPEPLFKAIADLDNKGLISANDIKINFAGGQADVMDYVNKYGINDYYEYLGMLPREESLKLQYNSDAVLFLEYENPEVKGILTGKLFEYLFISKFIIAVGCSNKTASGTLIGDSNSGICFGHDVEKIKNFLLNVISQKKTNTEINKEKDFSKIEIYSRKVQADKMIELI